MILLLRRRHVKHLGNRTSVRDEAFSKWHNRQPVRDTSFCFQAERFVFRGLGGMLRTGQHLHCVQGTPLANLWLTHARIMGQSLKQFVDSSDVVQELLT